MKTMQGIRRTLHNQCAQANSDTPTFSPRRHRCQLRIIFDTIWMILYVAWVSIRDSAAESSRETLDRESMRCAVQWKHTHTRASIARIQCGSVTDYDSRTTYGDVQLCMPINKRCAKQHGRSPCFESVRRLSAGLCTLLHRGSNVK